VNPDTIGYVWTGEYDLNTLRVDGEILESGTKKLWIRKYPDTCGQGLKYLHLPSNLVINIFTLTDNVLELNVNLEKYIFYMHYSVYSKLLAARIFADICFLI